MAAAERVQTGSAKTVGGDVEEGKASTNELGGALVTTVARRNMPNVADGASKGKSGCFLSRFDSVFTCCGILVTCLGPKCARGIAFVGVIVSIGVIAAGMWGLDYNPWVIGCGVLFLIISGMLTSNAVQLAKRLEDATEKIEAATERIENAAGRVEVGADRVEIAAGRVEVGAEKVENAADRLDGALNQLDAKAANWLDGGKKIAMTALLSKRNIKKLKSEITRLQREIGRLSEGARTGVTHVITAATQEAQEGMGRTIGEGTQPIVTVTAALKEKQTQLQNARRVYNSLRERLAKKGIELPTFDQLTIGEDGSPAGGSR